MPPRTKSKPVQPVSPTPPPAPAQPVAVTATKPPDLPVLYDRLEILEFSTAVDRGPITVQDIKDMLGWETESEFKVRKVREDPTSKPDHWLYGDDYHTTDLYGEKVRCVYNANNRPFDREWCDAIVEMILAGQWAGPFTVPGETVNGETIRISRYGRVLSGQHQGTALILASQKLAKAREDKVDSPTAPKYPVWRTKGEPFLETIVVRGLSEDSRVLMTVDYTKPRSTADVLYTSETFRTSPPVRRKELCRILAGAADTLWSRTDTKGYKTHPEVVAFIDRHSRLLDCVLHLFKCNGDGVASGRVLSKLRLNPGQCAALMYLMGSSGPATDGDVYRNENPAPSERYLDWSLFDKATQFWDGLATSREFMPVRTALAALFDSAPDKDDNFGLGGRGPEKLALIQRAWIRFRDHVGRGPVFTEDDRKPGALLDLVDLYTDKDENGRDLAEGEIRFTPCDDFGGVDAPDRNTQSRSAHQPPDPPPPSADEIWGTTTTAGQADKLREQAAARRGK